MKAKELADTSIEDGEFQVVVELPSGQRLSTTGFRYGLNTKGEEVLVILAGRKVDSLSGG